MIVRSLGTALKRESMAQTAIPMLLMRAGTSRGAFLRSNNLPTNRDALSNVLLAAFGAGHPLNIDGIGGGASVTNKVAIVSCSDDTWADIDYLFAQVSVTDKHVDFKPTCGNILSGVGPAALEMGLIQPSGRTTEVKVRAVNTGARVVATVSTAEAHSGSPVVYDGKTAIDGVPGTAAPIPLQFMDVVGSVTGALLPTGNLVDTVEDVDVTCIDVAVPMVIARAESLGLKGHESASDINANMDLMKRIERIRVEAGVRMGMGDVAKCVTPKFGVVAPARGSGTVTARYFTPWSCHPTMAVTGSQCLASCLLTPGTVAHGLAEVPSESPTTIQLEHPSGTIDVIVDYEIGEQGFHLRSAGVVRTARKLFEGHVFVPGTVWSGAPLT